MLIPLKLILVRETEVYFPRRPHDTFHPLIRDFWKGGMRGNTFCQLKRLKNHNLFGIKRLTLGGRNIKVWPLRMWVKEISDDKKKEFIRFHLLVL